MADDANCLGVLKSFSLCYLARKGVYLLILTRKLGEAVAIGSDIKIVVMQIRNKYVRLGISANSSVLIHREEVYERICKENQRAALSAKSCKILLEADESSGKYEILPLKGALLRSRKQNFGKD